MIDNVIHSYRQWRNYRDTVDELSRLSSRDFEEVGISRADITQISRRSVGR
ncbi:Uncharacterized conserved protein YjiS, DUF1127 family [Cohaesibacter sp. ES.047]|uniref:DUF1127 domain-containing protein n=1 Tax=Cohaesibacter sp. ES.047 TaxID=1798205 RepID=UPI000BB7C402|nr:DUF1127 domain-containing protein [Cohaesibacter sp. ES.047]SNY93301.1 Uncharacterized conserved protein YjiS, DUF1127 family [Cohaesibacter sp. ES.047]